MLISLDYFFYLDPFFGKLFIETMSPTPPDDGERIVNSEECFGGVGDSEFCLTGELGGTEFLFYLNPPP